MIFILLFYFMYYFSYICLRKRQTRISYISTVKDSTVYCLETRAAVFKDQLSI